MKDKEIEYFRIFFEVSRAILSSSSLNEMLRLLVKRSVQALGVKAGSLRLIDEKTNRLELVASHLLSKRYLQKGPLDADQSIPEVLGGKTVLIKDAHKDPRIQYRQEKIEEGINSVLSVPVIAKGGVIGVLRLYTKEPRDFSEEQIEFVSALAEMGGLAIANAKIHEDHNVQLSSLLKDVGVELPAGRKVSRQRFKSFQIPPLDASKSLGFFRALREVTTAILSTLNTDEVMELILEKLLEIIQVKGCSLLLINETTRELELVASKGLSEQYLKKGPLHLDKSISETLEGEPVLVIDARVDPRIEYPSELAREGIQSILSIPITAAERIIGVLRLYSEKKRNYDQEEVAFLSAIAEIAGIVIINAKFYERTRYDLSFWKTTLDYLMDKH